MTDPTGDTHEPSPQPPPEPRAGAPDGPSLDSSADDAHGVAGPSIHVLARESDYTGAQRVVDDLSDRGFPVEHLTIVGHGLRSLEHVTGRLTKGRAALQGAAGGAWFGLFVGLLIGLFVPAVAWIGLVIFSVLIGAGFGAAFGFAAHWTTRGRRDFSSIRTLAADEYHVTVSSEYADEAIRVLRQPG